MASYPTPPAPDLIKFTTIFFPPFSFLLSTTFFTLAVRHQIPTPARWIYTFLHTLFSASTLAVLSYAPPFPFDWVLVPSALFLTLHTASVLIVERKIVLFDDTTPTTAGERRRELFWAWGNPRGLGRVDATTRTRTPRIKFALLRTAHAAVLLVTYHLLDLLTAHLFQHLEVDPLQDYSPDKQALSLSLTEKDLIVRGVVSVRWVWKVCLLLTALHNILAVFFVSVLGWDHPAEWPGLFGGIHEGYNLRRFWGVFWCKIHVRLFEGVMPFRTRTGGSLAKGGEENGGKQEERGDDGDDNDGGKQEEKEEEEEGGDVEKQRKGEQPPDRWQRFCHGSLRAWWIFVLSGLFHAGAVALLTGESHLVAQVAFFFSNYLLCFGEAALGWLLRVERWVPTEVGWSGKGVLAVGVRVLGYAWVLGVFFVLVPMWQYPLFN
ncbi:hypothetical protein QBC41DRAFT_380163 [Cercophora samala]|uniref:Wax synthase domain-containing protein n=1 Tax=Cercophora samala TaxID=330535 RepID=A0AA39Z5P2_9PEZI|nr:hypothetical protein QBC41DRAFT_380163 [Cercophora samala]